MSNESNEPGWLKAIVKAEPRFNEIAAADGNLVTFKREAMFAHQSFERVPYLQKADPQSVFNAIVNVASVGLTLSPAEKLAYLVPRKDANSNAVLCCLDISYKGLIKIATDSGGLDAVVAEIVRDADEFEWFDKLTKPAHRFDPFAAPEERGDIRGVYCMARLASGTYQIEPLGMAEIEKIRAVSQAKKGPWMTWPEEMMKKTAVRRASKMWPHSPRMQTANSIIDSHQGLMDVEPVAPTHQLVEQPTVATPEPEAAAAPAATSSPAPEKKVEAMNPGQLRILRNKAARAKITDDQLAEKFGAIDTWKFTDFERIQKWIMDGGK